MTDKVFLALQAVDDTRSIVEAIEQDNPEEPEQEEDEE